MKRKILTILANSVAVFLLAALIIAPIYFANNFSQVAGVKTESQYLIISQTDKFSGMTFNQSGGIYTITFTKQAPSQAYLSIIIINNPTNDTKTYTIKNQPTDNKLFFGEDLKNQQTKINIPAQSSVPISLLSKSDLGSQSATFQIQAE